METELIVKTANTSASLNLSSDIPISLNYVIADIKDPSKRSGAFSRSIKLPGTDVNNIFFEHIYDVNVVTNNFNPNLKTECYVLQDSIVVFKGYLRLRGIEVELVNDIQKITYDVTILGDNQDLFSVIGDSKLQDLDVSEFNHVYNRVNQYASWTTTTGQGYVYPLIDYGYNAFLTNSFNVEHFRPAFYAKEYVDKIFAAAGKTYTSSYFNSAFFKKWIIPHNGDKFTMSASNISDRTVSAGDSGAQAADVTTTTNSGSPNYWRLFDVGLSMSVSPISMVCKFDDESSGSFSDAGNQYDTSTGEITIGNNGNYTLSANCYLDIKVTPPAGTFYYHMITANTFWITLQLQKWNGSAWTHYNSYYAGILGTLSSSYQTWAVPLTLANQTLVTGDKFRYTVKIHSGMQFRDISNAVITGGTCTVESRLNAQSRLNVTPTTTDYVSGQTLTINDAIPRDIKQKDFLVSIFRLGNLYVDVDPADENNYLIETRNDFYSLGSNKDWTQKLATDRPFNIKLMSEVDIKNFIYRYKPDSDYYNKKYEDANYEPYGTYKKVVVNDFALKDDINEVIFSPTVVVDNSNNSMIVPKIFSYDGTSVKPQKHNIRILMYNGVDTLTSGSWNYVAPASDALGSASLSMTTYPQAAMVDDPLNPTESIEFGVPNMVFYTPGANYTTNNIFNREYSKQTTELTDRDSRIVTGYFYLTPHDIATFDFRDTIYVKDTYYYVNKISDYNQIKPGLAKVELLKIKNADAYVPAQLLISQIETNSTNTGITARVYGSSSEDTNVGNANNVIIGDNNSSRSASSFISGSGNRVGANTFRTTIISSAETNVGEDCDNVNLIGCSGANVGVGCSDILLTNCYSVNVDDFVTNFIGIGLSDRTITADYNNTTLDGTEDIWQTKTANFNVEPGINYRVDCTGGDITATYDFTISGNKTNKFNRIDASGNLFKIDEVSGTATLEGVGVPVDLGMAQWETFDINNNGTDFFIV